MPGSSGNPETRSPIALSIIVPVLNDAECLERLLPQIRNDKTEVIVVDGGSFDGSADVAASFGATLIVSEPGRAKQMNNGAKIAKGDVLLFLHADSVLPQHFASLIEGAMRVRKFHWGRFDVRLSGSAGILRVIEFMMNNRSAFTGICTGDQGIFVRKEIFNRVGGFPEIALMEDIELSKRLPGHPFCIRHKLITSSRRWEQQGVWKTIGLMWLLRLRYFFGADPEILARYYRQAR